MLINSLCGMKCKVHRVQKPRHIQKYVEVTSTALHFSDGDSLAQAINQRFPGEPGWQKRYSYAHIGRKVIVKVLSRPIHFQPQLGEIIFNITCAKG